MTRYSVRILSAGLLALLSANAQANVVISSAATQNINCANGVCAPTAWKAVLNVTDLENLLGAGNIEITTTGAGIQAGNIELHAPLTWSNSSAMALDAYASIRVEQPVTVSGPGGLSVMTNDGGTGGTFSFDPKGHVRFAGTSNALSINGSSYTLVATLPDLISAIVANPSGAYALSQSYDARHHEYHSSPIATIFDGNFNGLGNTISRLTIAGNAKSKNLALFAELDTPASVSSLRLQKFNIVSAAGYLGTGIGGIAGSSNGSIFNSTVAGTIQAATKNGQQLGGVVGGNGGTIDDSVSEVTIEITSTGRNTIVGGGITGINEGIIAQSYSIGSITDTDTYGSDTIGALVGVNGNTIANCYATGAAMETGGGNADVGGLLGGNLSDVATSYSTGAPSGASGSYVGGLIGYDASGSNGGSITHTYWDTATSGITNLGQGAGNIAHDHGIKGETTSALQSALPKGFSKKIWAEKQDINNGLPYLIANPPQ